MKKNISVILLLLSIVSSAFSQDLKIRTDEFPKKEMKSQSKEIVKLASASISKSLPQVVDKYTTLVSVKGIGKTLLYTFEINTGSKSDKTVQNEDRSRMKRAVTEGICQSSSKFLIAGVNTSYIYISSKTKAHLFQFDISLKDCPVSKH